MTRLWSFVSPGESGVDSLASAAAPAITVTCWSSEYITAAGEDETGYRVTYEKDFDEKMLKVDTWFENGIPICVEVCYNNQRILNLTISDFTMK